MHAYSVYVLCARNFIIKRCICNKIFKSFNTRVRNIFTRNALWSDEIPVDTNVVKDVLLYRYDRPKYFRALNLFGVSQYMFWSYLAHMTFTTLRDVPVNEKSEDDPWWKKVNLGEKKYRIGITVLCLVLGHGILASSWLYTLKSVRYLVLRKGGNSVTLITYTPTGRGRTITTSLRKVSCTESRTSARVQLPLRVKDFSLYFILDKQGEFLNPLLFDHTVGMKRLL